VGIDWGSYVFNPFHRFRQHQLSEIMRPDPKLVRLAEEQFRMAEQGRVLMRSVHSIEHPSTEQQMLARQARRARRFAIIMTAWSIGSALLAVFLMIGLFEGHGCR
jgi:hypothetical protein